MECSILTCVCCGSDIQPGYEYYDDDNDPICYDCWIDDGSGFEQTVSDCW